MSHQSALDQYRKDSLSTISMSPARAIIALYDRLLLDVDRALAALAAPNLVAAHAALVHAQEIVGELHDCLDVEEWPPARQLAEVYKFLLSELIAANLAKNPAHVANCRIIIQPLRDAWAEAAALVPDASGAL
jgi:flagellar protein FliS